MDRVELGYETKKIIDNPAWGEIVESLASEIIEEWELSIDPIEREALWHKRQALTNLVDEIEYAVRNGSSEEMD